MGDLTVCKKCTWTKSGKRRAEISGAGFPSGQDTFCRPQDMKQISQDTATNNAPSGSAEITNNTPAGPDNLPKVTPAVNPLEPTVNAATTSDEQDLLQMPWRKRKKELYDMPWHELKEFAEAHEMNINFLKHERGGNKNGLIDDIMAHLGRFERDTEDALKNLRGYIPCPKCNQEGLEEIPSLDEYSHDCDTGCDESGRRGWVMMEPCGRDGCNPHGTKTFDRKPSTGTDNFGRTKLPCAVCGGARWNKALIIENGSHDNSYSENGSQC